MCSTTRSPGRPGVAVDEPLAGGRRDHERRVGGDQVEALVRDRLEEAALADLDPVAPRSLSAALNRVSRSARWFTSVATTCVRVRGQVQGLDAAAGAEVEGAADRLADGQLRQRGRRPS